MSENSAIPEAPAPFLSFPNGGTALVIGASGGIGAAVAGMLGSHDRFQSCIGWSRSDPTAPVDITDEDSIARAVETLTNTLADAPLRLVFDATGILQEPGIAPEKSWRALDPAALARLFAVNAIGPALLMKHLLPQMPRTDKAVFATISAKVGSIGDNQLGGWYGYRAAKAAQNQFVRTAAIELKRQRPEALCIALHPGTVDTPLSRPFARSGLAVRTPEQSARAMLQVIDGLQPDQSGGFFSYTGEALPW